VLNYPFEFARPPHQGRPLPLRPKTGCGSRWLPQIFRSDRPYGGVLVWIGLALCHVALWIAIYLGYSFAW